MARKAFICRHCPTLFVDKRGYKIEQAKSILASSTLNNKSLDALCMASFAWIQLHGFNCMPSIAPALVDPCRPPWLLTGRFSPCVSTK